MAHKLKYFGTDGIRGKVGEGYITAEFVLKLGWAVGKVLGKGAGSKVVIGKDTRISGYMFESALEAGLAAAGMDVYLLGPMPTPGIAYLTRTLHAQAGIVISASHNAFQDNGIKFFSGEGKKLPNDIESAIEDMLDQPMTTVESKLLGKAYRVSDAAGRYIEFCKSSIPREMNFNQMRMVLDCAHGATYDIAPSVFQELGAEVIKIGCEPDGLNINKEVGSTYIKTLTEAVIEHNADFGIALDGDGDRLMMSDGQGNALDGDDILYIIAQSRLRNNAMKGQLVGTKMTNLGMEHSLKALNIETLRTDVGDKYVMQTLEKENCILGGETSGHIICLDRTTTGDGIISALQVLAAMHETDKPLDALLTGLLKYPQIMINVRLDKMMDVVNHPKMLEAVASAEETLGETGRVLLRASGTEPLVRVMVEGRDKALVEALVEGLAAKVKEILAA